MFATFIDNKIMSQWEEKEPLLRVFDARIDKARLYNVQRAPSLRSSIYQRCSNLKESGKLSVSARACWSVLYFTENVIKIGAEVVGDAHLHQRSSVLNWQQETSWCCILIVH